MNSNYNELLSDELLLVNDAAKALGLSYDRCKTAIKKGTRSIEDIERLEALTSRFARLSDILVQKIFRLIDSIELENEGTILDRINRAEKRGLITSADTFKNMRLLRNRIAHEYLKESLEDIFSKTFLFTPELLQCTELTRDFCRKRYGN
jgi:uncharacterized protein YutE (UPF0331/DUF86 family)